MVPGAQGRESCGVCLLEILLSEMSLTNRRELTWLPKLEFKILKTFFFVTGIPEKISCLSKENISFDSIFSILSCWKNWWRLEILKKCNNIQCNDTQSNDSYSNDSLRNNTQGNDSQSDDIHQNCNLSCTGLLLLFTYCFDACYSAECYCAECRSALQNHLFHFLAYLRFTPNYGHLAMPVSQHRSTYLG